MCATAGMRHAADASAPPVDPLHDRLQCRVCREGRVPILTLSAPGRPRACVRLRSADNAQFEAAKGGDEGGDNEDEADGEAGEEDEDDAYLPPGGDWRAGPAVGGKSGAGVKRRLWVSAEARVRWLSVLQGPSPPLASVSLA
jgi:hypothetical protein